MNIDIYYRFDGRHLEILTFTYLDSIHNIAMEFPDPENVGVTVRISFLGVTESEIPCCMIFMY